VAPAGRALYAAGVDGVVRALDPDGGESASVVSLDSPALYLGTDRSGRWLTVIEAAGHVRWLDLGRPQAEERRLTPVVAGGWSAAPAAFDEAGRWLAVGVPGAQVLAVDLTDARPVAPVLRHGETLAGFRFLPGGERLVTAGERRVRWWRLGPAAGPGGAAAPDGRDVLLGTWDGGLRVVPTSGAAERAPLATAPVDYIGHTTAVTAAAMSPDRTRLASGSQDGVVRLWDVATGEPLPRFLRQPEGPVRRLAFDPTGERLASLGAFTVRVWSAATGELVAAFPAAGTPAALAWSSDGRTLAVGDESGTVTLRRIGAQAPVRVLRADAAVDALAFVPGEETLVAGDRSGAVVLWPAATDYAEPLASIRLPSAVRALLPAGGGTLYAVTEHWLHELGTGPRGVAQRRTLYLPYATDVASVRLVRAPTPELVALAESAAVTSFRVPLGEVTRDSPPAALEPPGEWYRRLGLAPTGEGGFAPIGSLVR
jgi:WD40 repeat protein